MDLVAYVPRASQRSDAGDAGDAGDDDTDDAGAGEAGTGDAGADADGTGDTGAETLGWTHALVGLLILGHVYGAVDLWDTDSRIVRSESVYDQLVRPSARTAASAPGKRLQSRRHSTGCRRRCRPVHETTDAGDRVEASTTTVNATTEAGGRVVVTINPRPDRRRRSPSCDGVTRDLDASRAEKKEAFAPNAYGQLSAAVGDYACTVEEGLVRSSCRVAT